MFRKCCEGLLISGLVFLFFLLTFERVLHLPGWLQVAGRAHPLFVHFPIVLVLLVLILYWLPAGGWGGLIPDAWGMGILRGITALTAVLAAIMGILLSMEGERSGSTLSWHKWAGVTVALLSSAYYFFYPSLKAKPVLGRSFTGVAAFCVLFTGHWGGDLTHGEGYLLGPVMAGEGKRVSAEKARVFEDIIQPLLRDKCVKCHNEGSAKGGLSLDRLAGLLAGGKSGALFVAGKPDLSLIIQRIHLPEEEKKHMPPASKPQLTDEEALLLESWVRAGAPADKKLVSLPVRDSFRLLAQQWLSGSDDEGVVYQFPAADEKKIKELNNNYRVIEPQGERSPALSVHFYGRSAYSGKAVEELGPLDRQITELSLARMPVKDDDLSPILKMENLRTLNLNYTDVTPKGVEKLAGCRQLQVLSLSGTAVSAASLEKVLGMLQLAELYVWDTKIDTGSVRSLRKKFSRVRIENGFVDDGQFLVALSPPVIEVPDSMFNPSVRVGIHHPYKGVQIKYTVDGSLPDSSHGEVYSGPLTIDSSVTLSTRAFKKGWLGSRLSTAVYMRSIRPDSAALASTPDSLYKKLNPALLYDGQVGFGDLNSDNGQWYGYRKGEAAYYLFYKQEQTLQQAMIYTLRQADFDNFPPTSIQVWGGKDPRNLKLLGKIEPPAIKKEDFPGAIPYKISFAPVSVRCLKLVAVPLRKMPEWSKNKGKPARLFISEILLR